MQKTCGARRQTLVIDALPKSTLARLELSEQKLREMGEQVRSVAALPDPLNRKLDAIELDEGLELEKISVPLGVLAVIFEARPDAVTQIASLAIKSGNAAILKPGREVEHTAKALVRVLRDALTREEIPQGAISLVRWTRRGQRVARDARPDRHGDSARLEITCGVRAGQHAYPSARPL